MRNPLEIRLRAFDPVVILEAEDQKSARELVISTARSVFTESAIAIAEYLPARVVFHSRNRSLEKHLSKVEDPHSFMAGALRLLNDSTPIETHYILIFSGADFFFREESAGANAVLCQMALDIFQSEAMKLTLVLIMNSPPVQGLPRSFSLIPRVTMDWPSRPELQQLLDPLAQTGDLPRDLFDEASSALFGLSVPAAQSIICRGLIEKPDSLPAYFRAERNRILAERFQGALEPAGAPPTEAEVPGLSPEFLGFIDRRRFERTRRGANFLLTSVLPGCGKSYLAGFMLERLGAGHVYRLRLDQIFQKWLGESESLLRRALDLITKLAEAGEPIGIIADEFDKTLGFSSDQENSGAVVSRVLAIFLQWITEIENSRLPVFMVYCANDPGRLPSELTRAGRLARTIFIDFYPPEGNARILAHHLAKNGIGMEPGEITKALAGEKQITPAELKQAAETAAIDFCGEAVNGSVLSRALALVPRMAETHAVWREKKLEEAKQGRYLFANRSEEPAADSGKLLTMVPRAGSRAES